MSAPSSLPLSQPWLFQWLRWSLLRNGARVLLTTSPLRVATIFLSVALIWGTGLGVSIWGMLFVKNSMPLALIGLLFDVLFLSVGTLLVFSTGIIVYGSLFKGAETAFLLTLPARADQVFGYKFQSAVGLSSLAFLWLGSPVVLVYGWIVSAPWFYYLFLPLFLLCFVRLACSLVAFG